MPLYQLQSGKANQIKQVSFLKEQDLQQLFEANLEVLLGVQFIASEFTTGNRQRRIDTLGLDQDKSPVIIEYKKRSNENIINQGLSYLDWLVDHKGDFTLAVQKKLGKDKDIEIDWSRPRLILIAEYFSEYDKPAVNRIGANIELWLFKKYGDGLLYLDPIYVADAPREKAKKIRKTEKEKEETVDVPVYSLEDHLKGKPQGIRDLYEDLRERIFSLDTEDAIIEKANKHYMVYKHGKNFCEIWIQNGQLKLWLDIPTSELNDPFKLAKDVSNTGHWGTGETEVNLENEDQLEKVMSLVEQAYQQTV